MALILDYTITLTDKDLVAQLQAAKPKIWSPSNDDAGTLVEIPDFQGLFGTDAASAFGFGNIYAAPAHAATFFSAPIIPVGAQFAPPCITSSWIYSLTPNDPFFLADFTRDNYKPVFPLLQRIWRGTFAFAPGAETGVDQNGDAIVPIAQRRWIDGFEMPPNGAGGLAIGISSNVAREASRHAEGYGLAIRGSNGTKSHSVTENGAAASNKSWERLYVRLRQVPSADVTFWRCRNSVSPNCGIQLAINSTGRIALKDTTAANVATQLAQTTNPLEAGTWHKLDLMFEYGATAYFRLYIDGVQAVNIVSFDNSGLGAAANHASSEVGNDTGDTRALGLDVDDWENAEVPSGKLTNGNDFRNGTKIVHVTPLAPAADFGTWVGNWRNLLQEPAQDGTELMTSSSALDMLSLLTNGEKAIDGEVGALGPVALAVGLRSKKTAAAADGQLGWGLQGNARDMAAIAQGSAQQWNSRLYRPAGLIAPSAITPVEIAHTKGNDGNANAAVAFAAQASVIGAWGPEDVVPTSDGTRPDTPPGHTGIHNSAYPRTPWARKGPPPISMVKIVGGTYAGNDTFQDLAFTAPVCFLWVRRITNVNGVGSKWWTSMIAAHQGFEEVTSPEAMVQALIDPSVDPFATESSAPTILRVVGNQLESNKGGETYQYIAFCDPGMRFALNAALKYWKGAAAQTSLLVNSNFLAHAAFAWQEVLSGSANTRMFFKGAGQAGTATRRADGTALANGLSFAAGAIGSGADIHFNGVGQQIPLAMFRRDDHVGDPGTKNVVGIWSYVGDGNNPRTVTCPDVSTKRPLFAYVQPVAVQAATYRDASHTGTTSTNVPGAANAANGIRGGDINSLIVGSDLNANGVTYDVFVLWGGDVACNGGFSCNGTFEPVVPAAPVDGPWDFPPDGLPGGLDSFVPGVEPPTSGGSGTTGDDLGAGCVASSTQVTNLALSHIGVTQFLTDIVNDPSVEAQLARLHYADEVDAVLRDFPWPFATAYQAMALVAGTVDTPVNGDWQYAYREPADCVYMRRIVNPDIPDRTFDPKPPPFRRGKDATAGLVFTNQPDATLEYTFRPDCAAGAGDALFRDALSWRLAAAFAPAIARNKLTAKDCLVVYESKLLTAKARAAAEQQFPDDGYGEASWIRDRG